MSAKLIELDLATIESASRVLRSIADQIDAGDYRKVKAAVLILDGDELALFGSGDANHYKAVYLLEAAKRELLP